MSVAKRLLRAGLALVGSTVVVLTVGAQLAPGWYPAPTLPPLAPAAAAPPPVVPALPTERVPVQVAGATGALAGWVTRPVRSSGPLPGVVLVPGAGASTRDSMRAEAETLAAAGVAVLSYDKRSDYGALHRDYPALADDAVRAADALAQSPGVDPRRIGLLGFSEGGWVAPLALQQAPDRFAFLALLSASVVTPLQETGWGVDHLLAGWPQGVRRVPATMNAAGRSVVDYGETDVTPALAAAKVPVLAVYGADDPTVPVNAAVRRLQATVTAPLTVRIEGGQGHHPAAGSGYLTQVAELARTGSSGLAPLTGTEPATALGVAGTPTTRWYHHPVLQTGFSVLVAVAVGLLPWPRRRGRRRSEPTPTSHRPLVRS